MRIRRAGVGDALAFATLTRREIETGLPHGWTAPRLARLLADENTNAYALVADEVSDETGGARASRAPTGLSVARFGLERGHLMLHAIGAERRGRGLGRELLRWQIEAATIAGLTRLTLEVRSDNARARRFYERCGFRVARRLPRYYAARVDALRMVLEPLVASSASPAARSGRPGAEPTDPGPAAP